MSPMKTNTFALQRIPPENWKRCLLLACTGLVVILVSMEFALRSKGYLPSVNDDMAMWALQYRETLNEQQPVVLLGSSRTHCDFQLETFCNAYGKRPRQLALVASSPIPILDQLSHEPSFAGLVLCEVSPELFFGSTRVPQRALQRYKSMQSSLFDFRARSLGLWLQSHLVCLNPGLKLRQLAEAVAKGEWPVLHNRMNGLRNRFAFEQGGTASKYDISLSDNVTQSRTTSEDENIDSVCEMVNRIRDHGGDVVMVYLPCRGRSRETQLRRYPKQLYWNEIVRRTGCLGIHSSEHETLKEFVPEFDFSHLARDKAEAYTRRFVGVLKGKLNE